jgi:hypothetical protein
MEVTGSTTAAEPSRWLLLAAGLGFLGMLSGLRERRETARM